MRSPRLRSGPTSPAPHSWCGRRLVVLAVLAPLSCGGGQDADRIRELSSRWLEYAQSRDASAIASLYAPDGVVLNAGEPPIVGPEAIQEEVEADWAVNPTFSVDWQPLDVSVARSGDLAWERGRWSFDADGPGPADPSHGEYVTVWQKIDGDWKVAADIGVVGPPEPPAGR